MGMSITILLYPGTNSQIILIYKRKELSGGLFIGMITMKRTMIVTQMLDETPKRLS